MNQHETEDLSALIDGEITREEADRLVELIADDPLAREKWGRLHTARAGLQQELSVPLKADFADRVRLALEHEPKPVAAGSFDVETDPVQAESGDGRHARPSDRYPEPVSIEQARRRRARSADAGYHAGNVSYVPQARRPSMAMPLAGLAVAAGIVGITVFSLNPVPTNNGLPVDESAVASAPEALVQDAESGLIKTVFLNSSGTRWTESDAATNQAVAARLNGFLTQHLESATMGKVHGMLLHSRVVSYDHGGSGDRSNEQSF